MKGKRPQLLYIGCLCTLALAWHLRLLTKSSPAASVPMKHQHVTSMVVFGDSMSDTGNDFALMGVPSNETYYQGRFSNGPVWQDEANRVFGFKTMDYAYGGAPACKQNVLAANSTWMPALEDQVKLYLRDSRRSKLGKKRLIMVWIGHNDYFAGLLEHGSFGEAGDAGRHFDHQVVDCIMQQVARLIEEGENNIVVSNLAPLYVAPLVPGRLKAAAKVLVEAHNAALQTAVLGLQHTMSGVQLRLYDVHKAFQQGLHNASVLGFTNTVDACQLTRSLDNESVVAERCLVPQEHVFWDTCHPTTAWHTKVIARNFADFLRSCGLIA